MSFLDIFKSLNMYFFKLKKEGYSNDFFGWNFAKRWPKILVTTSQKEKKKIKEVFAILRFLKYWHC